MSYFIEKDNKNHILLIILSVITGVVYTVLFHKTLYPTLNYTLFMLLMFSFTYVMLARNENFNKKTYLLFTGINFLYALSYTLFMNTMLRPITFLAVPLLYITTVLTSTKTNPAFATYVKYLIFPFAYIFRFFSNLIQTIFSIKKSDGKNRNIFYGILFSILLLIIILPLMFSSDMLLNTYFHRWFENFDIHLGDIIYYVFFFSLTSAYAYGFIRFAIEKRLTFKETEEFLQETSSAEEKMAGKNFKTQIYIVLSVATAVYALFCIFQFVTLIIGYRAGLPLNFDYAQYARSGFFQLVALTIINLAVILIIFKLLTPMQHGKAIQILLSIFTALTLLLAVSSFYRMHLYEAEYGYTMLRLFVYLLLIFEFAVLAFIFIKIYKPALDFIKILFIIALFYYLAVLCVNTEAYVAKKNIDRYFSTGKIDVSYLYNLSTDAADQFKRLENVDDNEIQLFLTSQKQYLQNVEQIDFRRYNYSIAHAKKVFEDLDIADMVHIQIINESSVILNEIVFNSDNETQVMDGELAPYESCDFYLTDTSSSSYSVTFTDEASHTQTLDISLDFNAGASPTLFLYKTKDDWSIQTSN